ncbi:MAG: ATP-dependent DNA helicase [Eubacteriales bacterium]|nr:ATP-dependent DNA helicase [Eubacteriales bacterium]
MSKKPEMAPHAQPTDQSVQAHPHVLQIAVRALAEATHRQGGLGGPTYASITGLEGTRLHQKLVSRFQKRFGKDAVESEVTLKDHLNHQGLNLKISGRCDLLVKRSEGLTLYEIKSYSGSPQHLPAHGELLHWAQAMLYGHLYCQQYMLDHLIIGLLYTSPEHDEYIEHYRELSRLDLAEFYQNTIQDFTSVAVRIMDSQRLRDSSAKTCAFPFPALRPGQKQLMNDVIGIARQRGVLFAQAPTGTGKTISVLFPAVRLLAHHLIDKVFYLTAMTSTRRVAEQALNELRQNGLILRSITLQAKEKSCLKPELYCDTQKCPMAVHYYRDLPKALNELFKQPGHCSPADIAAVAKQCVVCPFELSLDYALYCDVIIGDYNYAFDPRIQLARFFVNPDQHHLLLVDEAHNLPDRAREMYSAILDFSTVQKAFDGLKNKSPYLEQALSKLLAYGQQLNDQIAPQIVVPGAGPVEKIGFKVVEPSATGRQLCDDGFCAQTEKPESLLRILGRLIYLLRQFLDDHPDFPEHKVILDAFLMIHFFNRVADQFYSSAYVTTATLKARTLTIHLMCLDASTPLTKIYLDTHPVIYFSATLAPLEYYTSLLLEKPQENHFEQLNLPSPFPFDHLKLIIESRLSTRYKSRAETMSQILEQILTAVSSRIGNYLVFLPSYGYLQQVRLLLRAHSRRNEFDFVVQIPSMDEQQKQQFLGKFELFGQKTLVGLAVMGSLFNEGIDLTGERLSGVVIVGVGLPQICPEREITSQYFSGKLGRGFEFAYQYPGFNKVQQAAGRVIRSETDVGFVLLIDDRYAKPEYQVLYPNEWQPVYLDQTTDLTKELTDFWSLHKS